jgi:hypothetical protein
MNKQLPDKVLILFGQPVTTVVSNVVPNLLKEGFSVICLNCTGKDLLSLYRFKPDVVIVDYLVKDNARLFDQVQTAFDAPIMLPGGKSHKGELINVSSNGYWVKDHGPIVEKVMATWRKGATSSPADNSAYLE